MKPAYFLFKHLMFRPGIKLLWRPWITGAEHIPAEGPAILAANHVSAGDTIVLPAIIRRRVVFLAKADLFHGKGFTRRVVARFLRVIGMVPMNRTGGRASAESLQQTHQILADGNLLAIFPEGTRSPDGRLYKGKTGMARLALAAGAPVIPVGLIDSEMHRGPFGFPMMKCPGVRIGEPLDFSEYQDRAGDRQVLRWVTDEVMAGIQNLTGQEYVDAYGTSVKSGNFTPEQLATKVCERPGTGEPPLLTP